MAERDYVRLGCSVEACAGDHKAHGLCFRHYKQSRRGGVKADLVCCKVCEAPIKRVIAGKLYCSKACKTHAWFERTGYKPEPRPPKLCAYWAGYCLDCSAPIGGKAKRERCSACAHRRGREAWRASAEALHRAAGRVTACARCSLVFCPTYGASHATMCAPCSVDAARAVRRAGKAYRRAVERSVTAERVDPFVVFERDGWSCRMCGIVTPKSKRGTYEPDAPELDHIKPLSKGGEHSYANTQCACRRCNGLKSDRFEAVEA